ncbi:olfactory receptor 14J1-like, partial [Antrostomus carolinensis]|uniref:olfactory receptor 14J1-like n=1 Tax=Antrostomus carolinensis TaxID=279965 RepID=UPI0010A99269
RACVHMAAAAWSSGFLNALLHTANTLSLPLCKDNAVDQFFCEVPQILKLSCSDAYLREVGLLGFTLSLIFGCFIFIVLSYVQIFRAVLRIPSEQGRHKAFSTCLPHLAVVSLYLSTGMFAYLKPFSISSPSLDLLMAVLYSVLPPAVNPLVYSMRNQDLKDCLRIKCKEVLLPVYNTGPQTTAHRPAKAPPGADKAPPGSSIRPAGIYRTRRPPQPQMTSCHLIQHLLGLGWNQQLVLDMPPCDRREAK